MIVGRMAKQRFPIQQLKIWETFIFKPYVFFLLKKYFGVILVWQMQRCLI